MGDAESFEAEICPCGCAMEGCVCSSSCKGECLGAESFDLDKGYLYFKTYDEAHRIRAEFLKANKPVKMRKLKTGPYAGMYRISGISRWQQAESFGAKVYQSEELVPFYSHRPLRPERPSDDYSGGGKHRKKPRRPLGAEKLESETFKSSNNYNSVMDAESKFDKLSDKIAKQYRKKGMSAKEAKEIGNKTAYTIGARKYGKAGMARKARAGMRAESFDAEKRKCILCKKSKEIVGDGGFETFEGKKMKGAVCSTCEDEFVNVAYEDYDLPNTQYVRGAESFATETRFIPVQVRCATGWFKDRFGYYPDFSRQEGSKYHSGYAVVVRGQMVDKYDTKEEADQAADAIRIAIGFLGGMTPDDGTHPRADREMIAESFSAEGLFCPSCKDNTRMNEDEEWCHLCEASFGAESFDAQGNPDKRTTTQYANFYVGFEDDEGELRGGGKFKKYDDALAQADIVSEREGNSRIVTTRGFALWTDDGKGMWQEGYDKTVAKEFYSAEGYTIGGGFRLGFGLGLGMLALSTAITILALAVSKIDERQVD